MTKILKPVCLMVILALVLSLVSVVMLTTPVKAQGKSLYVIADINGPGTTPIEAWEIQGTSVSYQATYNVPATPGGIDAVGIAIDSDSRTLFVTYEGSGTIQLLNAITFSDLGTTTAPSASNLAGIVFDHDKGLVYTVDRSTNHLYVYDWDPSGPTLTLVGTTYVSLADTSQAYGIALDETNDRLFVADYGGGTAGVVNYYSTSGWSKLGSFTPSYDPTGIAVDYVNGLVYTGSGDGSGSGDNYLCQYNMGTSTEATPKNVGVAIIGIAVDQATGLVYCTTGNLGGDDLRVFNSSLTQLFETDLNVSGDPTGLCIPIEEIGYGYEPEPPVAAFSATPPMGEAPHAVKFRDRSTGEIDEWSWSFGDGSGSSSRYPSHTYYNEGTYRVCLTVTGPGGTDVQCTTVTVEAMATAARLSVRNLNITPGYADPRQEIAVNANVVNEGGMWGSAVVNLLINAQFEQSASVGVAPGTSQPISFTVYKVESGKYEVDIEGATGTFYVMEEAAAPAPQKTGLLAGGELDTGGIIAIIVIGVILVGGVVVAILLTRPS